MYDVPFEFHQRIFPAQLRHFHFAKFEFPIPWRQNACRYFAEIRSRKFQERAPNPRRFESLRDEHLAATR